MSDSEGDTISIVLDNGSDKIKGGFSGDDSPRAVFSTVVGRGQGVNDEVQYFIGDAACSANRLSALALSRPIKDGVVVDWDDMERVWEHLFNYELRVPSEGHPVFVTETQTLNSLSHRDKMAEVLFERLNVPSCVVIGSALPALVSSGRTCGVVVDSGRDVTTVTPLHDAHVLREGMRRMNLAGSDVTSYLGSLLSHRGYTFPTQKDNWSLDDMKRCVCYVATGVDGSDAGCTEKEYRMPNGQSFNVGTERHMATECLFEPTLVGKPYSGLAKMVHDSIESCYGLVRNDLYSNILLVGATTMFPGIVERLTREVNLLASPDRKVRVIAPPERKASVWIGSSILTSLSFSDTMWITKYQYQELGPVVLRTDWEPPPGLGDL